MSQTAVATGATTALNRQPVRCREIEAADLAQVIALLCEGFPLRSPDYWRRGFEKLALRDIPAEYPRYGFVLDAGSGPVGILLMLYIPPSPGRFEGRRTNFSSWYVKPEYRPHTIQLIRRVLRVEAVTFVNISASPRTFKFIEAQGFKRYAQGVFVSLPWLSARGSARVLRLRGEGAAALVDGMPDAALLLEHAATEAVVLLAQTDAERIPFVFVRRSIKRSPRVVAQLAYCRTPSDFVALAGPLGRHLFLREGLPLAACDASAPIATVPGVYLDNYRPKYFKGPAPPPLDDFAYSEAMVFGI